MSILIGRIVGSAPPFGSATDEDLPFTGSGAFGLIGNLAPPFDLGAVADVPLPADLLAAVELAVHGFALLPGATPTPSTLAEAFGEVLEEKPPGSGEWVGTRIRRDGMATGDEVPYAAISLDFFGPVEEAYDGIGVQAVRLRADVFAYDDPDATRLAKAFRKYFGDGPSSYPGEIEWEDGVVTKRTPDNSEPESIGQQQGPGGPIYGRRVRVEFEVQYQAWE